MSISYPRELPLYGFQEATMVLQEFASISRNSSGKVIAAVDYADPFWRLKVQSSLLESAERASWEAWKASLRGGLKTFVAFDPTQPEPMAYPGGVPEIIASTWNGEGDVTALAARLITATGTPTDFTMTAGDKIGLVEGGKYGLFTVTETVTRGMSTIAVPVEPAVPLTVFTTAAVAVFRRPKAEFILLPESWESRGDSQFSPISFEAVQKL